MFINLLLCANFKAKQNVITNSQTNSVKNSKAHSAVHLFFKNKPFLNVICVYIYDYFTKKNDLEDG